MSSTSAAPRRRRGARLVLSAVLVSLAALVVPALALADAANPDSITQVSLVSNGDGTTTLTIQGTWEWPKNGVIADGPCDATQDKRAVGFAIDWNDPNQPGNVITTGIDVGTPTDNNVYPAGGSWVPCTVNTGTWGSISHTYAAGTTLPSSVCAVMYDVHLDSNGVPETGGHGTIAGGKDRNQDNSVEENAVVGGNTCAELVIITPVTFRSFTAKRSGHAVTLRWKTGTELNTLGFNLYVQKNGKRVKLNRSLIAGKGVQGGSYAFKTRAAKKPTRYWIEVVDLDGRRTFRSAVAR